MDSRNLLCGHFGCCAVVLCIAMWYGACTQVSFASFTATEEARVYDAVVDVASGLPLEDAVIRLLPPAEIQIFTAEEVETLSNILNVLDVDSGSTVAITDAPSPALEVIPIRIHEGSTAKPVRTDADGIVEMKIDYLLSYDALQTSGLSSEAQLWMLLTAPNVLPLSTAILSCLSRNRTFQSVTMCRLERKSHEEKPQTFYRRGKGGAVAQSPCRQEAHI